MEQCYEYFGCKRADCIMYQQKNDKHCWQVEGTLCHSEALVALLGDGGLKKKKICRVCTYSTTRSDENYSQAWAKKKRPFRQPIENN